MDISNNDACSNNTNKLSPQELQIKPNLSSSCSNNTNKLSPQEPSLGMYALNPGSNNTNKLSPQKHVTCDIKVVYVQIIQINLVLKNLIHGLN